MEAFLNMKEIFTREELSVDLQVRMIKYCVFSILVNYHECGSRTAKLDADI